MAKRFDPQREYDASGRLVGKICCTCRQRKPVAQFSLSTGNRDGYRGQCKACRAAYFAARSKASSRTLPSLDPRSKLLTGATFRAVHDVWPLPAHRRPVGRPHPTTPEIL